LIGQRKCQNPLAGLERAGCLRPGLLGWLARLALLDRLAVRIDWRRALRRLLRRGLGDATLARCAFWHS